MVSKGCNCVTPLWYHMPLFAHPMVPPVIGIAFCLRPDEVTLFVMQNLVRSYKNNLFYAIFKEFI